MFFSIDTEAFDFCTAGATNDDHVHTLREAKITRWTSHNVATGGYPVPAKFYSNFEGKKKDLIVSEVVFCHKFFIVLDLFIFMNRPILRNHNLIHHWKPWNQLLS